MVTICTHDGNFHADEVLACCMLLRLPEYKEATIVRTRDPSVIQSSDVVVDVGGEYDHSRNRYDHHQRGFAETFTDHHPVKLSSAGLVYKRFGRRVIEETYPDKRFDLLWREELEMAFFALYENFIEEIDATDNGVKQWPQTEGPPIYVKSTTLSARIARMNGAWNEEYSPESQFDRFLNAMAVVNKELDDMLVGYVLSSWLPGRTAVRDGMIATPSSSTALLLYPQVVVFSRFCPWRDHLHAVEIEQAREGVTKYVIYPENDGVPNTRWRVQAVNVGLGTFDCRLPFPEAWRGLNGDALSRATGIAGSVFVHAGGFIAGNDTLDGALEMASAAMSMNVNIQL